jgi:OOP family OmpA-OmpF porin
VGSVHVRGDHVVLDETIQFKSGSATLQPVSNKVLKQVAAVLKGARSLSVEIQGHTDDVGNAATNIKLSQKRAEAIRAFLVKAGVSDRRLRAKGFGPTRPRATNATADGREQNRRVEFLILGEKK